jgi:hypothetical protein
MTGNDDGNRLNEFVGGFNWHFLGTQKQANKHSYNFMPTVDKWGSATQGNWVTRTNIDPEEDELFELEGGHV